MTAERNNHPAFCTCEWCRATPEKIRKEGEMEIPKHILTINELELQNQKLIASLEASEKRVEELEKLQPVVPLKYCKTHKTVCQRFKDKLACCLEADLTKSQKRIEELDKELKDGDYWMERAKQFISNGGCPLCFCSDEEGHKETCEWGKAESSLAAMTTAHCEAMALVLSHEGHIAKFEYFLKRLREAVENHKKGIQGEYQSIGFSVDIELYKVLSEIK